MEQCLGAENSSYTNTFKVELETVDRLLIFIPLVPTVGSRWELNKNSIMLLAFALYPYFYGLAPDGVDIAATRNKDTVQEEP